MMDFRKLQGKNVLWYEDSAISKKDMPAKGKIYIDFDSYERRSTHTISVYVCQNVSNGSDCGIHKKPFKFSYVYSVEANADIKTFLKRINCKLVPMEKKEFNI